MKKLLIPFLEDAVMNQATLNQLSKRVKTWGGLKKEGLEQSGCRILNGAAAPNDPACDTSLAQGGLEFTRVPSLALKENNIDIDLQHELQMSEDNLDEATVLAEDVLWNERGSYPRVLVLTGGDSKELHRIRCIVSEAVKVSIYHDCSPFEDGVFRIGAHDELPVAGPKRLVWVDVTTEDVPEHLVERVAGASEEGFVLITSTEAVKDKIPGVSALPNQPVATGSMYAVECDANTIAETKGGEEGGGHTGEGSTGLADVRPAKRKVHASFSSQSAMTMLQLNHAVGKANWESTVVHIGQNEMWWEVWSAKAKEAHTMIVLFDKIYKVNMKNIVKFYFRILCKSNIRFR